MRCGSHETALLVRCRGHIAPYLDESAWIMSIFERGVNMLWELRTAQGFVLDFPENFGSSAQD
jgi:hypothetical protein